MAALPAVLLLKKAKAPLLVIVALPAVLLFWKFRFHGLMIVAVPAVLLPWKFRLPVVLEMETLPLVTAMPAPVKMRSLFGASVNA
ncbi:hypothetical protein [Bradyrhizobium neotropicale]|uniref:hypothetical protein n=1 Tax=Bradyrhizobium neotropicale TaxID=1497615 RepID=UPI001FDA4314|nr:hypothetical protein [Bradyrhizobium neotropicale]